MVKVHILATCSHCNGEAYQPVGETEDSQGHTYTRYTPCSICQGSGVGCTARLWLLRRPDAERRTDLSSVVHEQV